MKKFLGLLGFIAAAALLALTPLGAATTAPAAKPAKNVIVMIPDGLSLAPTSLARWMKGSALSFDALACGLVATHSSDATIADSAPAGSAYATGFKSQTGNIASLGAVYALPGSPLPEKDGELRPVATILEAAKLSGRATGLISTSEFMHATPADFASHGPSRKDYDALSEQIIFNNVDVVLGGGYSFLAADKRADKDDMVDALISKGYEYVVDPNGLAAAKSTKLFGLFAPAAMAYDLDRDPLKEPSLADMTAKAISTLSANKAGFFLMVEGSKVDWAAHANDPVGIMSDLLAFDKACQVALDFAKKDGNTVVVIVSDHGNSGFSIGDKSTSSTYDKTPYSAFITPLLKAKKTGEGLEALIKADKSNIAEVMAEYYAVSDLTEAEIEAIKAAKAGSLNYTVGPMIAARAKLGFTTTGHTGEDVVLYAYDPRGARPAGRIDNTDVGKYLAAALGLDLAKTTKRIFAEAEAAFAAKKAVLSVDSATDPANVRLVAKKGAVEIAIVQNRDYAIVRGLPKATKGVYVLGKDASGAEILAVKGEGVAVYNGKKWYVSQNLIDLIE